jgi:LPS export ABC transporter protein LptC
MYRRANILLYVLLTAALCPLLFSACTNDLKKIRAISAQVVNSPADTTTGVDMILSDSGRVKGELTAPLMLEYQVTKENPQSYKLMPKGIKIILYDKNHMESAHIIADTAYYYEDKQLIKFYKDVVITSIKNDVFKTQELIYDKATHKITSNKPVDLRRANGDIGHGTSLATNEEMNPLNVLNATGSFFFDRKVGQ